MADYFFNALLAAAANVEVPIDGQTGVWLSSGGVLVSSAMVMSYSLPLHTGSAATQANVYRGGVLAGASVGYWGTVNVSSGGTLSSPVLYQNGGNIAIRAGGLAQGVEVLQGRLTVFRQGLASGVILSGGSLAVSSGGTALAVTSNAGAVVVVEEGGYIEYVTP